MPFNTPTDTSTNTTALNPEQANLESAIAEREAHLARLHGNRRVIPIIGAGMLALLVVLASSLRLPVPSGVEFSVIQRWLITISSYPPMAVVLGISVALFVAFYVRFTLRVIAVSADIELLETKKRIAAALTTPSQVSDSAGQPSYFDSLVRINVDNLAEYYTLVKVHTNNSFRASLLAGLIGFTLILIGVIAGFGGKDAATPAKLAAVSGIMTEFISGVFFYLYNRTVRQLKEYHDSLLAVQNILLALKLVNESDDAAAKRDMTAQVCRSLLIRPSSPGSGEVARPSRKRAGKPVPTGVGAP